MTGHGLNEVLFSLELVETSEGRDHWATRPWTSSDAADRIRKSNVVILPWENFREGQALLFPQGTTGIFRDLENAVSSGSVSIAVERSQYSEITLHSNFFRNPKILVTAVMLPIVLGVIANRVDRAIPEFGEKTPSGPSMENPSSTAGATVELELIVEGQHGKCISVKYKGPANNLVESVIRQVEACLPRAEKPGP
jgi:hypothetical protein